MMKAWLMVSLGSLLLYGCTEVKYVKPGATKADFEADTVDCRNQTPMSPIGPTLGNGPMGRAGVREGITSQTSNQSTQREIDQCLREKGWVPETQSR
jgi:hypothetical protein